MGRYDFDEVINGGIIAGENAWICDVALGFEGVGTAAAQLVMGGGVCIADPHPQDIEDHNWIPLVQRPVLPFSNFVQHSISEVR